MTPELYHIFLKTVILFSRPDQSALNSISCSTTEVLNIFIRVLLLNIVLNIFIRVLLLNIVLNVFIRVLEYENIIHNTLQQALTINRQH